MCAEKISLEVWKCILGGGGTRRRTRGLYAIVGTSRGLRHHMTISRFNSLWVLSSVLKHSTCRPSPRSMTVETDSSVVTVRIDQSPDGVFDFNVHMMIGTERDKHQDAPGWCSRHQRCRDALHPAATDGFVTDKLWAACISWTGSRKSWTSPSEGVKPDMVKEGSSALAREFPAAARLPRRLVRRRRRVLIHVTHVVAFVAHEVLRQAISTLTSGVGGTMTGSGIC